MDSFLSKTRSVFWKGLNISKIGLSSIITPVIVSLIMISCTLLCIMTDKKKVKIIIRLINTGKAPGINVLSSEVIKNDGEVMVGSITCLIVEVWDASTVQQNWVDAKLIQLNKVKGHKSNCGDFRGISLIASGGKVFAQLLLNCLQTHIYSIGDCQCGF